MKAFWLKPRQLMLMDAHGGRPARNFYLRPFTVLFILVLLLAVPFVIGAWYTPFHGIQEIIPENLKLKRQNEELKRAVADSETLSTVKDEQIEGLKEQLAVQESAALDLTKELHMFKTILDERKGKGIQILKHKAAWLVGDAIEWQSLFVKGGSYPRYLVGSYQVFALDAEGKQFGLSENRIKYRFESHAFLMKRFQWKEEWLPTQLELVVYNSRRKEVLKQTIQIQGK